jgi:membrane fusion protein (multidrug efflux system)
MNRIIINIVLLVCLLFNLNAQEAQRMALPPAPVVVGEVSKGMIAPEAEFIGTVFYNEVSEVAAEVSGRVDKVYFQEGQKVKKGEELVSLDTELLEKTLKSTEASYEQVLVELEKAKTDLRRAEKLYKQGAGSEQVYDDARFALQILEKRSISLKADMERIEAELKKAHIYSPFNGLVIEKKTEVGEWLAPGDAIATVAMTDALDIIVNVPQRILPFIEPEAQISTTVEGKTIMGKIVTVIPRGNVATRTFPVKVRIASSPGLIEGMEARVSLPTGEKEECLTVPRDALTTQFGQTVVFSVQNSAAKMYPVKVCAYLGMRAGIEASGLQEGMKVVIKGNERLQAGQPVEIIEKAE